MNKRNKVYTFPINFNQEEMGLWEQFVQLCKDHDRTKTAELKKMIREAVNQGDGK